MTRLVRGTANALILRSRPVPHKESDTGRRLTLGQVATSYGETWDKGWQFIVGPAGAGWASAKYMESATAPAPAPSRFKYTLGGEDPELTAAIEKLAKLAAAEGIEFTTADFGGVRTEADTVKIMKYRDDDYAVYVRNLKRDRPNATPLAKNVWRKIAPFGSSYHNYGCARDLKPTNWPPSFTESKALERLRALAPKVGLKTITNDPPHVQLPITLAAARKRWEARQ